MFPRASTKRVFDNRPQRTACGQFTWMFLVLCPFVPLDIASATGNARTLCLSYVYYFTAVWPPLDALCMRRAIAWAFPGAASVVGVTGLPSKWSSVARASVSWFLVGMVGSLSTPVVRNMASKKQSMNRTFEPLRIVNTYGAFGSISKVRESCLSKTRYNYQCILAKCFGNTAVGYDGMTVWMELPFRGTEKSTNQKKKKKSSY